MKTVLKLLLVVAALGMLAAAGCKPPLDLSTQRNRIFLMGRLLAGEACDVRLIWRNAPGAPTPVAVTADLTAIGGGSDLELISDDNNTAIWRWTGQVEPDMAGEHLITITAVDAEDQQQDISKRFRVFDTDKAIAIAAGVYQGLALKADGTVVQWSLDNATRVETPVGLADVTAISASSYRLALTTSGTVVSLGCDREQCEAPEGLTDVVAIAAGDRHSLALKADGSVIAWGEVFKILTPSPGHFLTMYVPEGLADVVAIGAGDGNGAVVQADGTLVGYQFSTDSFSFSTRSSSLLSDVVAVAQRTSSVLALKSNGTLAQFDSPLPARVSTVRATAIAAGVGKIALQEDGSVVVWSYNWYSQWLIRQLNLVFHRLKNIIAVAAAQRFDAGLYYLALAEDGSVISWKEQFTRYVRNNLPVPEELE